MGTQHHHRHLRFAGRRVHRAEDGWGDGLDVTLADGGEKKVVKVGYLETSKLSDAGFPQEGEFERNGYTFLGWAATPTASAGNVDANVKLPSSNVTYYAIWQALPAEISFDLMGGAPEVNSIKGVTDGPINNTNMPGFTNGNLNGTVTRAGYDLLGWWDAKELPEGQTALKNLPSSFPVGHTTYYAIWDAAPATIGYSVDSDVEVADNSPVTAEQMAKGLSGRTGQTIANRDMPIVTRDGWIFNGWYDNESLAGGAYTRLPETFPAGDTVFYAGWTLDEVTVSFVTNGGSAIETWHGRSGTPLVNAAGDPVETMPLSVRENYLFGGWYRNNNLTGEGLMNYDRRAPSSTTTRASWCSPRRA